jgi:hypothetical protein
MKKGVETRLDGSTLVVRIPMRFQRRGGRKRIVAPDSSEIAPTTKPQPDGTLVKALARAWRWQRMLDDGVCASGSEIGDVENISKSYVSRILRLALLAPDIVEPSSPERRIWAGCWAGRERARGPRDLRWAPPLAPRAVLQGLPACGVAARSRPMSPWQRRLFDIITTAALRVAPAGDPARAQRHRVPMRESCGTYGPALS